MVLPQGTPSKILAKIFKDSVITTDTLNNKNLSKVNNRFGTEYEVQGLQLENLKTLRYVPSNFTRLFNYAKDVCSCHHSHLTIDGILSHKQISLDDFLS